VVGTICMDQIMVDIGDQPDIHFGDDAILIGRDNGNEINISEIAEKTETNVYEILCGIAARVPRIYL
jgi:alanine racemase